MCDLEVETVALQLIDKVAHQIYVVGSDDVCVNGNLLDLAFLCVCNAGEEVYQTVCLLFGQAADVEKNDATLFELIGNFGCLDMALGLEKLERYLLCIVCGTELGILTRRVLESRNAVGGFIGDLNIPY